MRLKPRKSVPVPGAKPVTRLPAPSPTKKMTIIPTWLHRSPSQPAGNAPTPKSTSPKLASSSSSP